MRETKELKFELNADSITFATRQQILDALSTLGVDTTEYANFLARPHAARIMFLAVCGSRAYGTADENSDLDIRGVFLPTAEDILLGHRDKHIADATTDTVLADVRSFIRHALSADRAELDMLYSPDDCVLFECDAFAELREYLRASVPPAEVANTLLGIANDGLRKVEANLAASKGDAAMRKLIEERVEHELSKTTFGGAVVQLNFSDDVQDEMQSPTISMEFEDTDPEIAAELTEAIARAIRKCRRNAAKTAAMTARQLGKEMERAYTAATTGAAILSGSNTGIRLEESAKQTARAMKRGDMLDTDGHPTEQGIAIILDAIETLKRIADAAASDDGGKGKRVPVADLPAYREAMLAASRAAIALG